MASTQSVSVTVRLPSLEERIEKGLDRRREAKRKAHALLLTHLDEAQRAEMAEAERFTVVTPRGFRMRITYGDTFNVQALDEDGRVHFLYCLVVGDVPIYDQMLAQKLLLETDEDRFFALANEQVRHGFSSPEWTGTSSIDTSSMEDAMAAFGVSMEDAMAAMTDVWAEVGRRFEGLAEGLGLLPPLPLDGSTYDPDGAVQMWSESVLRPEIVPPAVLDDWAPLRMAQNMPFDRRSFITTCTAV